MPLSRPFENVPSTSTKQPLVEAAGVFLRRFDEKSQEWQWLLLKNRKRGDWGLPKGHQEQGECFCATALRECAEETGIALFALVDEPYELRYTLPSGKVKRVVYFPPPRNKTAFPCPRNTAVTAGFPPSRHKSA